MNTSTLARWPRVVLALAASLVTLASPVLQPALAAPQVSGQAEVSQQISAQDVYVVVGSTLRHPTDTTSGKAPLFNEAGVNLGLTWKQWQAVKATTSAEVKGTGKANERTVITIHLKSLIPGGVYSIFYGTITPDSENPLCPHVERTLPLIATNPPANAPDASSFIAGADGKANFKAKVPGNLLSAMQVFYSVVYHWDGQTYGSLPNKGESLTQGSGCHSSFGQDAMRQLIVFEKFS